MRLIMTILLCGCCTLAFADAPVGTVTFVEGVADILRQDGRLVALREGDSIELNERIRTKSYSKVEITLADKSVLKLAASSCVTIKEFSMSASGLRQRCVVLLSRGKAQAQVAKTGAPDTFIIETPNARGAVKGSDIFVSYLAGRTGMFVAQGAMSVVNPAFPATKRTLSPGTCLFVPTEKPPDLPRQAMKTEMSIHKRDVEPQLVRKWVPSEKAAVMEAVITAFSGTVRVHKKSVAGWSSVAGGEVLTEGDRLQTGEDGRVELKLTNGNTLFIAASTEFFFSSLRYDPASGSYHNQLEMIEGEVLAVVEKIRGESTFEVRTPTAVSAVRGTIMRVVVEPALPAGLTGQTRVFFEGGRGDVISLQSGITQQLLPGQNVRVDASGVISQPIITSVDERAIMLQELPQEQIDSRLAQPQEPLKEEFVSIPTLPEGGGQEGLLAPPPPPGGEVLTSPSPPPPYDQINDYIWYKAPMPVAVSAYITTTGTDLNKLSLKTDGTWNLIFNGAYSSAGISSGWYLDCSNPATGDTVSFENVPVEIPADGPAIHWSGVPDSFQGLAKGPEVDRTLTLDTMTIDTDPETSHITVDAKGDYEPL